MSAATPASAQMQSLLGQPSLLDCRRLFLQGYEIRINIGVNVVLYVPLAVSTPKADALDEVVDYDFIRSTIAARVSRGHIHLQETLCDDVLALLLANPRVRAARVSSAKPDVYPDCAAVGCEVFGMKAAAP